MRVFRLSALSLLSTLSVLSAQQRPAPTRVDVAPGVHLFQTAPYGDVGLDGNAVVIVGDDGVLVFDANGTPDAARAVLAEIRKLTPLPVRYLVLSHWHWDHWYGAEVYRDAFPGLEVISHEASRRLMAGPAIAFNQPGLDVQLPGHIAAVRGQLSRGGPDAPGPADSIGLAAHVALDEWFLAQKRNFRPILPSRTFTDSLTLQLGDRLVQLRHHDRAVTPGDTYLYLPAERLVVLGDLLINPITFALFCYPDGWIRTLEAIDALDASILVPGHGAPMRDESRLHATLALLRRERALALAARGRGETWQQARGAILADAEVLALRGRITDGDVAREPVFALYLVDWFVQRVYQEADGRLDDTIPEVP